VADEVGRTWFRTADPEAFAAQLVDAMLATDDAVERVFAFSTISQLVSVVTPVVDRLSGTPLHGYRTVWPVDGGQRPPTEEELVVFVRDFAAFGQATEPHLERLEPGVRIDVGALDVDDPWPSGLLDRVRANGRLTAADLEEFREHIGALRSDVAEILEQRRS
jgi:hypothetical protein